MMRTGLGVGVLAAAIAAVSAVVWPGVTTVAGQTAASKLPARVAGKPNFTGLWQALTEANWDLQPHEARQGPAQFGAMFSEPAGVGVVEGNEIPYRPEALAKKKANFENRWTLDPEARCYMPGVPRATYMPFPFQIIQGPTKIIMAYEFASASRLIHMDKVPDSPADSWMGWSRGRWEGDTLIVDSNSFNDQTWFDRAGNYHSELLQVVERFTLAGPDTINYEATMTDPKVFTRPWKISLPLHRRVEKNAQFLEFKCVPFSEELIYGHLRKKTN
jgi:hypothetical protein